jgi:predicted O-methyltransferase YrrM
MTGPFLGRCVTKAGSRIFHLRAKFARRMLTAAERLAAAKAGVIFTHLTEREKWLLLELARRVPRGGVAVEIGSYLGASASFLALGLRRRGARLYCVDTWQNEAMTEGPRDTFAEFIANVSPFTEAIRPLRGRSKEVGADFTEKVSLLFIDGDHSYEAVHDDWLTWLPHLAERALVAFHDCGWAEGVQRVIREDARPRCRSWHEAGNLAWGRLGPWR